MKWEGFMIRKEDNAKLRNYYPIILETGMIITLLLMIGAFTSKFTSEKASEDIANGNDTSKKGAITKSKGCESPPPPAPPRLSVPVNLPEDEIIKLEYINFKINDIESHIRDDFGYLQDQKEADEEDLFVVVEKQPQLKGSLDAIHKKIIYPEMARKAGIEGKVIVQFVINKKGEVENPKVIRGIGGGCDKEALRVVKTAQFTPGMQYGKPVHVQFTLPITFQLGN